MITSKVFNKILTQPYLKHDIIRNSSGLYHLQCRNGSVKLPNFQLENNLLLKFRNYENTSMIGKTPVLIRNGSSLSQNFVKMFNKVIGINKMNQERSGFLLYLTLDEIDVVEFYKLVKFNDTFHSWFKVIELHVWMLLVRLMQNGETYRNVRSGLVTAMWEDVERRAKIIVPLHKKFKADMRELSDGFKTSLFCYDEGFLSNDIVLCNAVWTHFFNNQCDDPRLLEAIVKYIRYQIHNLQYLNINPEEMKTVPKKVWAPFGPILKGAQE